MSLGPRPGRRTSRSLLSRYPLTIDLATVIAQAAANAKPALIVLVFDEQGLLIAIRPEDVTPAELEESARTLFSLMSPDGRGPAVVVTVESSLGADTQPFVEVWPRVSAVFTEAGATLLDWLLVRGDTVASVAATCGEAPQW